DPANVRKMQALADELYDEVLKVGGTISGEHGSGLSRTWFLRKQFGPLYDVLREGKRIFDPQNLLNPGKVVADVPQPLTKNFRPVLASLSSERDGVEGSGRSRNGSDLSTESDEMDRVNGVALSGDADLSPASGEQ